MCIALVIGAPVVVASQSRQPVLAFVDVTVIPMERDGALEHQTVIVRDGLVATIGPSATVRAPSGATVVDGRGKFLVPGLGDAHAHLSFAGGGTAFAELGLQLFALHGVTMIRSMYTEPHHRRALNRVESGEIIGPRAVLASPAFTGQTAPTPQLARDSIRKFREEGYLITKILPGITRETFDTLVAESKRLGMSVAGHIPQGIPLQHALASGVTSIEHLDGFMEAMNPASGGRGSGFFGLGVLDGADESLIASLVDATRKAGTVIVPTEFEMELFVSPDSGSAHARRDEMRFLATGLLQQWIRQKDNFTKGAGVTPERAARYRDVRRRIIRELHAAGVAIALGSDAFNLFNVPGPSVVHEMEAYVGAGLTPPQALRTATVNVAQLLNLPNVTGTVATGSVADLLLLDANPLDDVRNVRRSAGVLVRGTWYDRKALEQRRRSLEAPRP